MSHQDGDAAAIVASFDEPERFAAIFDRRVDAVHAYLARRAGRSAADDLTAEVFRIAFERRHSFDTGRDTALPWLYGIAGNVLLRAWRTGLRRDRAYERAAATPPATPASPEEVAERRAELAALAAALRRLPDIDREALLLHTWEHLPYEDIAAILDVPIGTVRSRIHRARARLHELLTASGHKRRTEPRSHAAPGVAASTEGPRT